MAQRSSAQRASSGAQAAVVRPLAARPQRGSLQTCNAAATGFWDTNTTMPTNGADSMMIPSSQKNTWIEKPEAVKDFATLQSMLDEIQQNIALRQDTISLLTGEVQRLRTQMGGLEGSGLNTSSMSASSNGLSASSGSLQLGPGSPSDKAANMAASMLAQRAERPSRAAAAGSFLENAGLFSADKSTQANVAAYAGAVAGIVFLGGVVAPVVEDKLGLGGPAYYDFITSNGLPNTMAEVDPIVASHAGGAVGVLTAQLAQEAAAARRTGRQRQ
ncbi:hypothetical protein ABPG77_004488 [Micractinium sp. CCAP 211/92]